MSYGPFSGYPRIYGQIGTDAPIEIWRRPPHQPMMNPLDFPQATRHLDLSVWTLWIERTTLVSQLISDRPKIIPMNERGSGRKKRVSLSAAECDRLVDDGVTTPSKPFAVNTPEAQPVPC